MYLGHFAVGIAAKRLAPRTSLALLVLAAQTLDVIWPALVLAGLERVRIAPGITAAVSLDFVSYPWSHSLAMSALWAILFAAGYLAVARDGRGAVVLGGLVLSHWVLDFASHRPDMPLAPVGPKVGLGLWYSLPASMAVELGLLAAAVWLYVRTTRARNRFGRWGLVAVVAVLVLTYLGGSITPPTIAALAWTGLIGLIVLVVWFYFVDRNREARTSRL